MVTFRTLNDLILGVTTLIKISVNEDSSHVFVK